jgi:hypothetical protein
MTNRITPAEDINIGIYMDSIIDALESEKTFSELMYRPSDKEIGRYIRIRKNIDNEDTLEFNDHLKPLLSKRDDKDGLYDVVSRFGKSRGEVIKNLADAVLKSRILFQSYRDALIDKIEQDDEVPLDETEERNSRYRTLQIQEMDMRYLNVFGGKN